MLVRVGADKIAMFEIFLDSTAEATRRIRPLSWVKKVVSKL